ncbi:hypothetical protein [Paenibacillus glycanilyticus]|uniref:Uncharacterized protein n=1 Tax=Paenibacillus glycanilyticus TaxID=126569 RepID=A0ABQ6G9A7_9BACL|nr:hypothetical protein [Paenibacillus glycanilyticus]GLX67549.1 hypothetical protein MU1_18940 [Paenibacillus glycanilyticus]
MNSRLKQSLYILLTVSIAIGLMGCGKAESDSQAAKKELAKVEPAADAVKQDQDDLINKFNTVVHTAKEASDIVSFLNENLNKAGQNNADRMVRELYDFYNKDVQIAQKAFMSADVQNVLTDMDWPITSANAGSIPDNAVRQLVVTKLSGGYKLVWVEGTIYPIVDYSMQHKYSSYLSRPLNSYIALKAAESEEPAARDAGLVITWDELASRAIMTEAFLKEYPDSPDYTEVKNLFLDNYLRMFINGLANSPIFDMKTLKIVPEVKSSYLKTYSQSPNTITGIMAKHFLAILDKTDDVGLLRGPGGTKLLQEVDQFQKNYRREAVTLFTGE